MPLLCEDLHGKIYVTELWNDIILQQYFDTYSQLQHSFIANLDVEKADVSKSLPTLDKYDLVYSIIEKYL